MPNRKPMNAAQRSRILSELHRDVALRQQSYRGRALALLPHICASCGREFSGKRLQELTVHHKDGDFKNNPPDGSNWELLCLYCHDHEHEKFRMAGHGSGKGQALEPSPSIFSPFDKLDRIIKPADIRSENAAPDPGAQAGPGSSPGH